MPKPNALSKEQIHLIAKALADPRRYEILKQLGEKTPPCHVRKFTIANR